MSSFMCSFYFGMKEVFSIFGQRMLLIYYAFRDRESQMKRMHNFERKFNTPSELHVCMPSTDGLKATHFCVRSHFGPFVCNLIVSILVATTY